MSTEKKATTFRYLFAYPQNIFNGDTPLFELEPLKDSDITLAVVFAGNSVHPLGAVLGAISHIYIETSNELTTENSYKNIRLYENLLCLVSGKQAAPGQSIDVSKYQGLDEILKYYLADRADYNKPDIQHHGSVREYNIIGRLPACIRFMNTMKNEHRERAERALATFIIAEEIGMTVNPQTKVTVRAALYLSAINQLADNPELCAYNLDECPECHKKDIRHQKTSHPAEIEKLMRELFTGDNLDRGIKFIKDNYNRVRSPFLHDGKLSGGENEGGWFANDPANLQFFQDLINFTETCRRLIELYVQKRANES